MNPWVALWIAILSEVIGTLALKASEGFTRWAPSVVVVLGYGAAFYFLSVSLRSIPVGVVYAIWSGAGLALIVVASWFLFGQRLDLAAFGGLFLILSGILVLQCFSQAGRGL
ncbi:multidrug efflux SMR transporter [Limisphaera ngatamarikiensis]|uniref:Multidrug efflux SMR transporter n=1 Tax=Limisphaera ngatamarikiensis TaxID=1324935 RepID=A0A6M1RPA6_9BACT|nr:multidrug efflux SMR transporter [Limisphaera ngatamarikiensis]NGO39493.1 multidrug efflux SMR transporter [Limisphaera ngatamarikiensis]